ncbi:MAG: hypothetical protein WD404_04175 [Solirubrobacterales bacterium]
MATPTATGLLAAAIAVLALPAVAAAEYFVPPDNSAATQYTEAVPTAGGHRDSEKGRKGDRTPTEVLGKRRTQRLDEHGAAGRKVAEVVAVTAPNPEVDAVASDPNQVSNGVGDGNDEERERPAEDSTGGSGLTSGSGSGPSGSSGLGEVLAQATGASAAGQFGLLLPLAIAMTAAWALAFLLRQRNRPTP